MHLVHNEYWRSLQATETEVDEDFYCVDHYARRKDTQCFWLHQG